MTPVDSYLGDLRRPGVKQAKEFDGRFVRTVALDFFKIASNSFNGRREVEQVKFSREWIINTAAGNPWPEPGWFDQPALGRTTINTPHDLKLMRELNKGKPYSQQIRPGGFLTLAHAHPNEESGLLIAPYTKDPEQAVSRRDWIHRGTGETGLRVRTRHPDYAIDNSVVVLDYRHYAMQYRTHAEWKKTRDDSSPERELSFRHVTALELLTIGKEGDSLEPTAPVEAGNSPNVIYAQKTCEACGQALVRRQRRWCSDNCRRRYSRCKEV